MTEYISVATTTDDARCAERIAGLLLETRLAACVQTDAPITSRYWWQGKLETSTEWRLTIKTRRALFAAIEVAIRSIHSYTTPQLLATPIVDGNADYFAWIDEVTGDQSGTRR
jgi:periplasmic divalent cation tolerance protein